MARIGNYSNTQKYSKRKSFDGCPVESGKVLVPGSLTVGYQKKYLQVL